MKIYPDMGNKMKQITALSIMIFLLSPISLKGADSDLIEVDSFPLRITIPKTNPQTNIYITSNGKTAILKCYQNGKYGDIQFQVNDHVFTSVDNISNRYPILSSEGGTYILEYNDFTFGDIAWNYSGRFCAAWIIKPLTLSSSCVMPSSDSCASCIIYNFSLFKPLFKRIFYPFEKEGPSRACFVVNGKTHCIKGDIFNLGKIALSNDGNTYALSVEEDEYTIILLNGKEHFRIKGYNAIRDLVLCDDGSILGAIYKDKLDGYPGYYILIGKEVIGPYRFAENLKLSYDGTRYSFTYYDGKHYYFNFNGRSIGPYNRIQNVVMSENGKGYGFIYEDGRDNKGLRYHVLINDLHYGPYTHARKILLSTDGSNYAFEYSTLYKPKKSLYVTLSGDVKGVLEQIAYVRIGRRTFGPYRSINAHRTAVVDMIHDFKGFSVNREISNYAITYEKDDKYYIQMKDRRLGPYRYCSIPRFSYDGTSFAFFEYYGKTRSGTFPGERLVYNGDVVKDISDFEEYKMNMSIQDLLIVKLKKKSKKRAYYIMIGNKMYGPYDRADFVVVEDSVHIAYLKRNTIHLARLDLKSQDQIRYYSTKNK